MVTQSTPLPKLGSATQDSVTLIRNCKRAARPNSPAMKLINPQATGALELLGRILQLPDNAVGGYTHTPCLLHRPRQLSHDWSRPRQKLPPSCFGFSTEHGAIGSRPLQSQPACPHSTADCEHASCNQTVLFFFLKKKNADGCTREASQRMVSAASLYLAKPHAPKSIPEAHCETGYEGYTAGNIHKFPEVFCGYMLVILA